MKTVMSSSSVIIAIDPGAGGGIAICAGEKLLDAHGIGSDDETIALFKQLALAPSCVAYMEQVGGYIGKEQPGSMMFNFGNGFGANGDLGIFRYPVADHDHFNIGMLHVLEYGRQTA